MSSNTVFGLKPDYGEAAASRHNLGWGQNEFVIELQTIVMMVS